MWRLLGATARRPQPGWLGTESLAHGNNARRLLQRQQLTPKAAQVVDDALQPGLWDALISVTSADIRQLLAQKCQVTANASRELG
jgi:hypothetical protein